MKKLLDELHIFLVGMCLILCITVAAVGGKYDNLCKNLKHLKEDAILLNYARYNPITKEWQWIKPNQ